MIKYSNGQTFKLEQKHISTNIKKHCKSFNAANRGMNLEHDINVSNEFYKNKGLCLVTKRPTPINVVKVDYKKGAVITSAYFEKPSTTDYNGVYKGRYIDFEAKSTNLTTSFPLANITKHQIEHLENVLKHNGIGFFIVEFNKLSEIFLIDAKLVIEHYKYSERRSIPYKSFLENGYKLKRGYLPRINYLEIVDKIYFS